MRTFTRREMMPTKLVPSRRQPSEGAVGPAPSLSEQEMVSAIRRGDGSVSRCLYDRLRPSIEYALGRVLRHRGHDLEDLVQVTFERAIRAIAADRFSGQSTLATWAAAIAGHVAIDYLRRLQVERRLFSDASPADVSMIASGGYSTERSLEARSEIQRLHAVLSRMKPKLAETVVLHDVLGHDLDEVATLTGASRPATRSRLHRARKELIRYTGKQSSAA